MVRVNRDVIEKRMNEIEGDLGRHFFQDRESLREYDYMHNCVDKEQLSQQEIVYRSIKNLNFHISRFTSENYALSTLIKLNKCMEVLRYGFESNNYERLEILKMQITYLEIALSLDITFNDSLAKLYEYVNIKTEFRGDRAQLTFNDIEKYYYERKKNNGKR